MKMLLTNLKFEALNEIMKSRNPDSTIFYNQRLKQYFLRKIKTEKHIFFIFKVNEEENSTKQRERKLKNKLENFFLNFSYEILI